MAVSRLSALESKIDELNNFLLKNNDDNPTEKAGKHVDINRIG
jgi:hypothetical protein